MFALVDCNSCYASCEQIFRPELRNKPVVVLSNNDCFIVARSAQAKALGISDLQSFREAEPILRRHKVAIFSSNYPLYGDISRRVMGLLQGFSPDVEVYSIDEMFLQLQGMPQPLKAYARQIKTTLWQQIRMPVGVGVAPTKTLAKLANHAAKRIERCDGVCVLERAQQWQWLQQRLPVTKIWGVAGRLARRLAQLDIYSAYDLASANPRRLRQQFGVNLERTIAELNGEVCFSLEQQPPPKQQIYCSRSFGRQTSCADQITQAVSLYASRAAEKLRQQNCVAATLTVFLQVPAYANPADNRSCTLQLPYLSDDSRLISQWARQATRGLLRPGREYSKAGVGLLELHDRCYAQGDLFSRDGGGQSEALMTVMDSINRRYGRGTLHLAAEGVEKKWRMRQAFRSPSYTTCWQDLPLVVCSDRESH